MKNVHNCNKYVKPCIVSNSHPVLFEWSIQRGQTKLEIQYQREWETYSVQGFRFLWLRYKNILNWEVRPSGLLFQRTLVRVAGVLTRIQFWHLPNANVGAATICSATWYGKMLQTYTWLDKLQEWVPHNKTRQYGHINVYPQTVFKVWPINM